MSSVVPEYGAPPVGGVGRCQACGRHGKRRQNLPDDPPDRRPRFVVCSAACAKRVMNGEFGEWRSLGWIK